MIRIQRNNAKLYLLRPRLMLLLLVCRYGRSPLVMASYGGYLEILALLLDCGATINHQDNEGMDALHWAIRRHHPEAVKLLLDHEAYPNNIGFVQVECCGSEIFFYRIQTTRTGSG